jgi:hypothetical protein
MDHAINIFAVMVLAACGVSLIACVFMLVRNEWVYRVRMRFLHTEPTRVGLQLHDALPSYDEMMRRWWVWNPAAFLAPPQPSRQEKET